MTLDELNTHLSLVEDYLKAKNYLQRLRGLVGVKAQALTGMPHGSGVSDIVGNTAAELIRTEAQVEKLGAVVSESQKPIEAWIDTIDDFYAHTVMRLRFIHGNSWGEVAEIIGGGNTEQSVKAIGYRTIERYGNL